MVLTIEEVLKDAIKPYAFYASEYPLILSIENHCSKKQQDRMAEHFKNILGKEVYENISDIHLQSIACIDIKFGLNFPTFTTVEKKSYLGGELWYSF